MHKYLIIILILLLPCGVIGQTAVHDTSTAFDAGYIYSRDSLYSVARGSTTGNSSGTTLLWFGQNDNLGGDNFISRAFFTFVFSDIPGSAIIDSAKIVLDGNNANYGTHFWYNIYVATYSSIATSEFDAFIGWQSGVQTYTGDSLAFSLYTGDYSDGDNVMYMRQSGLDSITAHIGDSLKLVILSREDVVASEPTNNEHVRFEINPEIIVSYHTAAGDSPRTLTNFDVYDAGQDTALYTVHPDTGDFSMWDSIVVYDATDTATVYGAFTSGSLADTAGTLSNLTIGVLDTLIAVMYAPVDTIAYSLIDTVTTLSISSPTAHYVFAGATGNNDGSDWTNAWTELPATLIRGDIYYVGAGTYSSYTFDDAVSGTDSIKILFADSASTPAIASINGWTTAIDDSNAVWTAPTTFTSNYWVMDGQVGGGPGNWTSGHGFRTKGTSGGQRLIFFDNGASNITISHFNLEHRGLDTETGDDGIYQADSTVQNITIDHCYLHDFGRVPLLTRFTDNWLFEYNYVARNSSSPAQHAEAWSDQGSDDMIVRYNMWADIEGTAFLAFLGQDVTAERWEIYGNVFFYTTDNSTNREGIASGTIITRESCFSNNIKVYNNTFINIPAQSAGIYLFGTGNEIYNNIWYNSNMILTLQGQGTFDYNWYYGNTDYRDSSNTDASLAGDETNGVVGTGDPFVDWQNGNFRLKKAPMVFGTGELMNIPPEVLMCTMLL